MKAAADTRDKFLDLGDRTRCQFLGGSGFDPTDDLRVKGLVKITQDFFRSEDDQMIEMIGDGAAPAGSLQLTIPQFTRVRKFCIFAILACKADIPRESPN